MGLLRMGLVSVGLRFAPPREQLPVSIARLALFVVYTWFGSLKVVGPSSATHLAGGLQRVVLPQIEFERFFPALGLFEVLVGVLLLFPALTRPALALLALHLAATILPLFVLSDVTWEGRFVPTLEGQYIIKNLLIVAAGFTIAGEPRRPTSGRRRSPA